jgi:hypothetical protein
MLKHKLDQKVTDEKFLYDLPLSGVITSVLRKTISLRDLKCETIVQNGTTFPVNDRHNDTFRTTAETEL